MTTRHPRHQHNRRAATAAAGVVLLLATTACTHQPGGRTTSVDSPTNHRQPDHAVACAVRATETRLPGPDRETRPARRWTRRPSHGQPT